MNEANINRFIIKTLSDVLAISETDIDSDLEFDSYGLSSSSIVSLLGEVEEFVDHDLSPSLLFKHNTVNKLSDFLEELVNEKESNNSEEIDGY